MYKDVRQNVGDSLIDLDPAHLYAEGIRYYIIDYAQKRTVMKKWPVKDGRGWVSEEALIPVLTDSLEVFNAL